MVIFWSWNDPSNPPATSYQLSAQQAIFLTSVGSWENTSWVSHSPIWTLRGLVFFFSGKICRKQWWNHGFHHWISYIDIINIIIYHYIMYHREPGNSKVSLFFCFNNFWENMVVLDTTPRRQSNTDTKEFDILILTMWQCHSLGTHMARWFWLSSASTVVTVRSRIPNQPTMAAEHHPFLMATNISIFLGISPCKNW